MNTMGSAESGEREPIPEGFQKGAMVMASKEGSQEQEVTLATDIIYDNTISVCRETEEHATIMDLGTLEHCEVLSSDKIVLHTDKGEAGKREYTLRLKVVIIA